MSELRKTVEHNVRHLLDAPTINNEKGAELQKKARSECLLASIHLERNGAGGNGGALPTTIRNVSESCLETARLFRKFQQNHQHSKKH